ncbi:CatA-like O-acetyltransferase [Olivibacter jilunii]|uniref:CatA-like O-acetyltransferase n=1 Tax=Olivibacter jilunii TaxID=985016 RepID=UPI003F5CF7A0
MTASFLPIDLNTWPRKPYFDYFYYQLKTKYNVNHHLEITALLNSIKKRQLKFYPTFLYLITKTVNQNEAFRMAFDENGILGLWNFLVPSYTIFHKDDKTFSDLWSPYYTGFNDFYTTILHDMEQYRDIKGIRVKAGRPANFCPISALPWLSFTSISQDTYSDSDLLAPIIRFGKYYQNMEKTLLPFSIYVHHAVADGYHTSKFINELQDLCREIDDWIDS